MLAENGGDTRSLKQLGSWRSDKVAESYVKNSLQNKIKNAQTISSEGSINIPQVNGESISFELGSSGVTPRFQSLIIINYNYEL
jgi:hypothetical protein